MNTPYTYHIAWTKEDVHYYGVRFAKACHPDDLWKTYFTSSKKVAAFRESHGEPNTIEIRKIFDSPEKARVWEVKVIRRLNAPSRKNWLNLSDHNDKFYHEGPRGPQSEEHKRKLRDSRKGRKLSEEHKAKLHEGRRNSKNSEKHAAAVLASRIGSKHSDESKRKMSLARKRFLSENPDKVLRRSWTPEQRKANGNMKRGSKWSPEQKAAHSETIKRMWAERKAGL